MRSGNNALHITSTRFYETAMDRLLAKADHVLAVHGRKDRAQVKGNELHDPYRIYLGGQNTELLEKIKTHLNENGFQTLSQGHPFPASDPNNLCNRGPTKQGAQIELPWSLRQSLMNDPDQLTTLARSLHNAVGP